MRYTKEQIAAALILFNKTGSAVRVTKALGYPTVAMLYRWPDWIRIMEDADLTRSMSKKGCSPDNYLHWYCADRIKSTLGGLSPIDYRRSIGVAV